MSIRLIATDLDGTLLNNKNTISAHTADVLRRAADMGYIVVPSTGRSYLALPPEIFDLPCPYLLIDSGSAVIERSTGKYIYKAPISPETVRRYNEIVSPYRLATNYITDRGSYMSAVHHRDFFSDLMANKNEDPFWLQFFRDRQTLFDNFDTWIEMESPSVQKINLFFRNCPEKDYICEQLEQLSELAICHSPSGNLEITHRNATKGKALSALAAHLGITPAEIIAFGDTDNDIDMLKSVGLGVAMANAIPAARAAADRITRSNNEDGVAWGIEQWVFNQV